MIFAAALVDAQMTREDFLKVIGHNPQFHGIRFKGKIELAESTVAAGKLRRFVWRLRDERETSNDLTLVVMFNQTTEHRSLDQHQFLLNRTSDEIQTYLDGLCDHLETDEVDTSICVNGNIVYTIRDCNVEWLNNQFAGHARKLFKQVGEK